MSKNIIILAQTMFFSYTCLIFILVAPTPSQIKTKRETPSA